VPDIDGDVGVDTCGVTGFCYYWGTG